MKTLLLFVSLQVANFQVYFKIFFIVNMNNLRGMGLLKHVILPIHIGNNLYFGRIPNKWASYFLALIRSSQFNSLYVAYGESPFFHNDILLKCDILFFKLYCDLFSSSDLAPFFHQLHFFFFLIILESFYTLSSIAIYWWTLKCHSTGKSITAVLSEECKFVVDVATSTLTFKLESFYQKKISHRSVWILITKESQYYCHCSLQKSTFYIMTVS